MYICEHAQTSRSAKNAQSQTFMQQQGICHAMLVIQVTVNNERVSLCMLQFSGGALVLVAGRYYLPENVNDPHSACTFLLPCSLNWQIRKKEDKIGDLGAIVTE